VLGVRGLRDLLVEDHLRIGRALGVLAEDGARFGLELLLVVVEVLKAIGFVVDDRRQRLGRTVEVMSFDVNAFESRPRRVIVWPYSSPGWVGVPRNIMCSKKCA
jgi:hypothetical protein